MKVKVNTYNTLIDMVHQLKVEIELYGEESIDYHNSLALRKIEHCVNEMHNLILFLIKEEDKPAIMENIPVRDDAPVYSFHDDVYKEAGEIILGHKSMSMGEKINLLRKKFPDLSVLAASRVMLGELDRLLACPEEDE